MSIDCCKSYVGKQIIGLLPSEQECLYYLVIDSLFVSGNNFIGCTINGQPVGNVANAFFTSVQPNTLTSETAVFWYTGTQPDTIVVVDPSNNEFPFTYTKVTDLDGSCNPACYQASFDYGYVVQYFEYFTNGGAYPATFGGISIDDEYSLNIALVQMLGPDITVSSVWNGSQYVVTINGAFALGSPLQFDDGAGHVVAFDLLPCEITPPEPVPLELLTAYPGATAGYSVRKLSTTYSGAAIRVRRSSDNTESDIGFDSFGNLDETALTTFVGANNGFVTKWYDQGGSARDFSQTTAANQPRIVSSGVIDKANNIPSLFFGVSNDINMTVSAANEPAFDFTNTYSIYICAKPANQTGDQTIFGKGTNLFAQTGYYISIRETTSNTAYLVINNSSSSPNYNVLYSNTSINLGCYGFNLSAGNGKASFNGTINNNYTGLISAALNNQQPRIGQYGTAVPNAAFDGWFSELIVYPTDQSSNRVGIETNITNYYSI